MKQKLRFITIIGCALLLYNGLLQADNLHSGYSYCDEEGNCTISGEATSDGSGLTGSDSSIFGVYDNDTYDYKTIVIDENFTLNANTAEDKHILGIWQSLDSVTNNGTLTNTNGDVIRVGSGGSVSNIYNYGTMTSDSDYALRISSGGSVGNIYNGSVDSTNAIMGGIYVSGSVTGYIYNYGSITGGIVVEENASINRIYNNGTITSDSGYAIEINGKASSYIYNGYDGETYNSDATISGIYVSGSASNIYNYGGTITNADSGYALEISGSATYIYNGSSSITGSTMGSILVSGSVSRIYNYNTIDGNIDISGKVTNLYNYGELKGDINIGGSISTLYNYGNLTGDININSDGSVSTAIYNRGNLTGDMNISGTVATIYNGASGDYLDATMHDLIVESGGSVSTFNNYAAINDIYVESGGSVTTIVNYNNSGYGIINNVTNEGYIYGLTNQGTIENITNSGDLDYFVTSSGIVNELNNAAGGNIIQMTFSSNATGGGIVDTLNNAGNIGTIDVAASSDDYNSINAINNSGSITTLYNNGSTIGDITNSGTITEITNLSKIEEGTTSGHTGEYYEYAYIGVIGTITLEGEGYIGTITNGDGEYGKYSIMSDIIVDSAEAKINTITNNGTMGNITNAGTITTLSNNESGEMGDVESSGTISTLTNDNIIGAITVSESGYIETLTNNATMNGDITVNSTNARIKYLTNNGEMQNITNAGTIEILTNAKTMGDIESSGTIDTITNEEGATMGYIDSSGDIDELDNYGEMGAIKYSGNTILDIYNAGTINLNSNVSVGNRYVQILGSNINITKYYFTINESASSYNSFSGYTSTSNDTSSHLAIGVIGDGSITFDNESLVISVGSNFDYYTSYNLSSLVALYDSSGNAINISNYESYGIELSDSTITLDDALKLEYVLIVSDNSFQIGKKDIYDIMDTIRTNFDKYSPAHSFYKNALLSTNTLIAQSESIMYSTPFKQYGFNANKQSNARFNSGAKKDYVISSKKPYSDFIQTAAYNDDTDEDYKRKRRSFNDDNTQDEVDSNIAISDNYTESGDDYFFFTPFVSHHLLYDNGNGMSYGFISGYNKEIDNSLLGFHIGFDYGNFTGDDIVLDIDTISILFGVHYRYRFSNDMYIKARGDLYYAYHTINAMSLYDMGNTEHPNTLGFNLGIVTGKQWNIGSDSAFYGIFNVEGGLNYLGLYNKEFEFSASYNEAQYTESYENSFMNLLYANIDAKYDKFIGDNWIINMALGLKVLLTPLPEIKFAASSIDTYAVSSKVNTDRVFGTAMLGVDYRITQNVSLMLNYVGVYGDKSMSNSGFFNVRVWW